MKLTSKTKVAILLVVVACFIGASTLILSKRRERFENEEKEEMPESTPTSNGVVYEKFTSGDDQKPKKN